MNRRGFLSGIIAACVSPTILLRAAPDGFKWNTNRELLLPNEMPFDARCFGGKWLFVTDPIKFTDKHPAYKSLVRAEIWGPQSGVYEDVIFHKRI